MGYVDQALARGSEAVEMARSVLPRPSLALSLSLKMRVAALLGEDRLVADSAQEIYDLTVEQGFPFWRTQGLIYRGWTKIRQGELEDGLSLLREGAAAYRATGAEIWTPIHSALEAEAEARRGSADVALGILEEALQRARARGENWFEAELVRRRGLLFRNRDPATAEALFLEAIDIARAQQAKLWELRSASSLARLWAEAGRRVEAGALLAPIHAWYTEGFDIPDLREARELLKAVGA
jgi:predicted ATPase